jgi:S-adenosylmethionine/arginine decarboxylase-like enzyme
VEQLLEHKHIILKSRVNNPPGKDQIETINQWMRDLVDKIDMKILMGPFTVYSDMIGNRGMTSATIIETSHIVMHTWDEEDPGTIQLDIYTCSTLDTDVVLEHFEVFDPVEVSWLFIDRKLEQIALEKSYNLVVK